MDEASECYDSEASIKRSLSIGVSPSVLVLLAVYLQLECLVFGMECVKQSSGQYEELKWHYFSEQVQQSDGRES